MVSVPLTARRVQPTRRPPLGAPETRLAEGV